MLQYKILLKNTATLLVDKLMELELDIIGTQYFEPLPVSRLNKRLLHTALRRIQPERKCFFHCLTMKTIITRVINYVWLLSQDNVYQRRNKNRWGKLDVKFFWWKINPRLCIYCFLCFWEIYESLGVFDNKSTLCSSK